MADVEWITNAELARRVGLTDSAIRYQIKRGNIVPRYDGKVDARDAEKLRQIKRVRAGLDPRSTKLIKVRVLGGAVKARRLKMNMSEAQARVVERDGLTTELIGRSGDIVGTVSKWPAQYAARLADSLGIDQDVAREALERFTAVALDELGDIEQEALESCLTT
jgi:DNA-binding transcriptional MerR regulator